MRSYEGTMDNLVDKNNILKVCGFDVTFATAQDVLVWSHVFWCFMGKGLLLVK